jgi:uncharacterized protein YutE (UPF0331/DUF86 family)/predicted nucleotidyltransferase
MQNNKTNQLIRFFERQPAVVLAFLFGSRARGAERPTSDWDVAVYFKPQEYMETETDLEYPHEHAIWSQLVDILESDNIDLVVLNRARPDLVYNVLRKGMPLVIKDRRLYLDLLCKVSYEAMDRWAFVSDYYKISERTKSIAPEDRSRIIEYLRFLENEFNEINDIKAFTWQDYLQDSFKRKIVERWIENLVMASLDIIKVILASQKREIPQTYRDILRVFGTMYIDQTFAKRFSWFSAMRNILVHEYLDVKWRRIRKFIGEAEDLMPVFIKRLKEIIQ